MPSTPDQRLDKLEKDQERIATLVMQIVTYIDNVQKGQQSQQPAFGNMPHPAQQIQQAPNPIAGMSPGMLEPILKLAAGFLGGGGEEQRDPFELEIYKGMKETFVAGFKTYITTVNQNAQIGAQVLEAIKAGKLKLDAGTAETAAKT